MRLPRRLGAMIFIKQKMYFADSQIKNQVLQALVQRIKVYSS